MSEREADAEVVADPRIGTVLRGKYRIDRLLGAGGMATVYKATHRNKAEFAVKMLHPIFSQREDLRARFLREGYAANSVQHPGVVLVVDDDIAEDGAAFLVMELLKGEGVEALWERRGQRLDVRTCAAILGQLLDVLDAASTKGIVHRDIKPANLFVTMDGTVKVLDFGIARAREAAAGMDGPPSSHMGTASGTLLGTPAFMPPEQALGRSADIDGRTDIWAAGATFYNLVSGVAVHEAPSMMELLVKAASAHAAPLASVAPQVPPPIAAVIDRALAFDREARWPTAAAMRSALEEACVAAFGRPLTKSLLVDAITIYDAAHDTTDASAPFGPAVLAAITGARPSRLPHAATESAPPGMSPVAAISAPPDATASLQPQPVSNTLSIVDAPGKRPLGLLVGVGVSVAAVAAVVVFLLMAPSKAEPTAASPTAATTTAPPAPSTPPTESAPPVAASPPPTSTPAASVAAAAPSTVAQVPPSPPPTSAKHTGASHTRPTSAPAPALPPPTPAHTVAQAPVAPPAPPPPPRPSPPPSNGNPMDIPIK